MKKWKTLRKLPIAMITIIMMLLGSIQPVFAENLWSASISKKQIPLKQIVVKYKSIIAESEKQTVVETEGLKEQKRLDQLGVRIYEVEEGQSVQEATEKLQASGQIAYVEPVYRIKASFTPNDTYFKDQWALQKVEAPQGWDVINDASSIVVAVIDSGVDPSHPDLQRRLIPGWNFVQASPGYNSSQTDDDLGHGTHVSGIIAASANNQEGIAGVAVNARIMPLKVLDSEGSGSYDDLAAALIWAADHKARIINLSLGGEQDSQLIQDAIQYAQKAGCLIVAAAGNEGAERVSYPAGYSQVMAVGASDSQDLRAEFSNYGNHLSVVAPGTDILSTVPSFMGESYYEASGTSMATPMVSGVAALVWAQDTRRSSQEVRQIIERNAVDVMGEGRDNETGYGRVDLYRSVTGVIQGQTTNRKTGDPLEGVTVEAYKNGSKAGQVTTDDQGYYELRLKPGYYLLRAFRNDKCVGNIGLVRVKGGESIKRNFPIR